MAENNSGNVYTSGELKNSNVGEFAVSLEDARDPRVGKTSGLTSLQAIENRATALEEHAGNSSATPVERYNFTRPQSANIIAGSPVAFSSDFASVITDINATTFYRPAGVVSQELTEAAGKVTVYGIVEVIISGENIALDDEIYFSSASRAAQGTGGNSHWTKNQGDSDENIVVGRVASLVDATNGIVTVLFDFRGLASEEIELFNTIVVATNGDDANDGKNFQNAVASLGRAMTLAAEITPTTDHKTILTFESRNLGNLINNTTIGNVANLIFIGENTVLENIDLSRKSKAKPRRCIGNILLGSGSDVEVTGAMGYATPKAITFVSGIHEATRLKINSLLDNVTLSFAGIASSSRVRVEIDYCEGVDFETKLKGILDTIPDGVEVNGWIGKHNFGESTPAAPDYTPVQSINEVASPRTRRLMLGAGSDNFLNTGQADAAHYDDVFSMKLEAIRIGAKLSGKLTLDKHVGGVNFPAEYYYREEGNTIVPTTNGTDTATSNLADYVGSSRRMWYAGPLSHALISNTSKRHTIHTPNQNVGEKLLNRDQNQALLVVFNFPDFNVNAASFEGTLLVLANTGEGTSKWNNKVRVRFNKVATNRYSVTLGTSTTFDTNELKISDLFKKSLHPIALDAGGRTNEVAVNGEVTFPVPFIANSIKLAEITIDTDVELL